MYLRLKDVAPCIVYFVNIIRFVSAAPGFTPVPRGTSPFNNGTPRFHGLVTNPTGSLYCNGPYGIKDQAGIPFSRANRGRLLFYGKGEGNTPDGVTDQWMYVLTFCQTRRVHSILIHRDRNQGGVDDPKQSACGIPHNAYAISHVAIHPYWLKYAPLDRKHLIQRFSPSYWRI